MSKRLSRSQRESIIIDYLNHKETPGYNVIENSNGKFIVRAIKEEHVEPKSIKEIQLEEEELEEPEPDNEEPHIEIPKVNRSKQNARELLKQLSDLLIEDDINNDDDKKSQQQGQYIERRYKPGPQNWNRRKLILN